MSGIMTGLITTLHILACVALMVAILLQSGKGGGLAGTFGAGSSQTLFGGRGAATFLSRAAGTLAVVFFLTSLTLGLTASRRTGVASRSLIQEEAKRRAGQRPAGEATPPPMGGATAPGQGLTPPATTPPATSAPPTPTAPSTTTPVRRAPAAQPPAAQPPATNTQPQAPAEQPPATSTPSPSTTEPTTPPSEGTTTPGGE